MFVAVEAHPTVLVHPRGRRLADVVKQDAEHQRRADLLGQQREHQARVDEHVAFRVVLGRLFAALAGVEFGQDDAHQPALVEQVEAAHPRRRAEDFHEFVADPFGADDADLGGVRPHGLPRLLLDLKAQRRREPHRAQETQPVLAEPCVRVPDGPQPPRREVCLTANVVDDLPRHGVEEHPVDREVAPLGVALRRRETHVHRPPSVDVNPVRPEAGDLELVARLAHRDDAEVRADGERARKQRLHLLRPRVGGDVEVLGCDPAQGVAHAPAGEVRGVPGALQTRGDGMGGSFHFHGKGATT